MLICYLYIFFGEVSAQIVCLFFDWVVPLLIVELQEFFIYFG